MSKIIILLRCGFIIQKKFFLKPYFLLLFLLVNLNSCSYEKTNITIGSQFKGTWIFLNSNNYEYNSDLIEFTNGRAQLKELDLNQSGEDFSSGQFVGVSLNANKVVLKAEVSLSESSVVHILPELQGHLLGEWRFEGNYSDSSGLGDTLIPETSVAITSPGRLGSSALTLAGAGGARLQEPANTRYNFNQGTLSAWIKTSDAGPNHRGILVKQNAFGIFLVNNILETYDWGIPSQLPTGIALNDNTWHHLALVVDSGVTNGSYLYLDGQKVLSTTITVNAHDEGFTVGSGYNPGINQLYNGEIDEVAVWDERLSDQQVAKLYFEQSANKSELSSVWTPRYENIVGYWKMNSNWIDSSGNNNHGVSFGDAAISNYSKVGAHSVIFDGDGDYLLFDNTSGDLDITVGSWGGWFKVTTHSTSTQHVFMEKAYTTATPPDYDYGIYYNKSTNEIYCAANTPSGFSANARAAVNAVANGEWRHLICTYNGAEVALYINGTLVSTEVETGNLITTANTGLHIGAHQNYITEKLTGSADDIAIWNTPLKSKEVGLIYNRQKQKYAGTYESKVMDFGNSNSTWPDFSWITSLPFGKEIVGDYNNDGTPDNEDLQAYVDIEPNLTDGLLGYWPLNETSINGTLDEVKDFSGNNMHGTRVGDVDAGQIGILSSSFLFNSVNDRINIPTQVAADNLNTYSYSAWIYWISDATAYFGIIGKPDLWLQDLHISSGRIRAYRNFSITGAFSQSAPSYLTSNNWYHVVAVFNEDGLNKIKLYINGSEIIYDEQTAGVGSLIDYSGNAYSISTNSNDRSFSGYIDEVGLWGRSLSANEVLQLYRRGANRIKLQVKSCIDAACACKSYSVAPQGSATDCDGDGTLNPSDFDDAHRAEFMGPGGDNNTYYSELYNRNSTDITFNCALNTTDSNPSVCVENEITRVGYSKPTSPEFLTADYTQFIKPLDNRYAQYRVLLEADENNACNGKPCLPELTSVNLNPSNSVLYSSEYIEIKPKKSIVFKKLLGISISAEACVTFRLARGGIYYYYDGSDWVLATDTAHRNTQNDLKNHLLQFAVDHGAGELEVIAYLQSDITQAESCSVDEIDLLYE